MISKSELIRWLNTLSPDASVGIDDGGLILVEIHGDVTGPAYYEVGGLPEFESDGEPD